MSVPGKGQSHTGLPEFIRPLPGDTREMEETNPIVLLTGNTWHIVEHSRQSAAGLCGQPIRDRRAHTRLNHVGIENICRACAKVWQANDNQA